MMKKIHNTAKCYSIKYDDLDSLEKQDYLFMVFLRSLELSQEVKEHHVTNNGSNIFVMQHSIIPHITNVFIFNEDSIEHYGYNDKKLKQMIYDKYRLSEETKIKEEEQDITPLIEKHAKRLDELFSQENITYV